ncbi:hypothetical protein JHL18_20880 [Clostridium sp. YIM B02505]|uniref:Uncharacterized protein n=1 Tax=Clostridium yunnanense TaxID=2800325 RepID=A0ABS1EUU9_9CLOT|nr:hypothetical protein [Clostridium yunnanense]MBK1813080.1 hypothetical protein [Clostridium yunnanense]
MADKSKATNKNKTYLPNDRDWYSPEGHDLISLSKTGNTYTKLPNPKTDPIVSNNISYMEFDYTDQSLYEDQDSD